MMHIDPRTLTHASTLAYDLDLPFLQLLRYLTLLKTLTVATAALEQEAQRVREQEEEPAYVC